MQTKTASVLAGNKVLWDHWGECGLLLIETVRECVTKSKGKSE